MVRPVTLDGIDIDIPLASLSVDPTEIEETIDTIDGGSITFGPLSFTGAPDHLERFTFEFPIQYVAGETRRALERARARGGYHTFAYWKPLSAFYTADGFTQTFYLPRYRRNAAQALAGLIYEGVAISTDTVPFSCWVDGVPQTVLYGPALPSTAIAAGSVFVASAADLVGDAAGHAPFRLGTSLAQGSLVEIEFVPLFVVRFVAPKIRFPKSLQESHTYTLQER
jgi:hypothetical protein